MRGGSERQTTTPLTLAVGTIVRVWSACVNCSQLIDYGLYMSLLDLANYTGAGPHAVWDGYTERCVPEPTGGCRCIACTAPERQMDAIVQY